MTANVVLLVTASYDETADCVVDSLNSSGTATFRLNTDQFPTAVRATFDSSSGLVLESPTASVHSSQISAVWYRRNVASVLPEHIDKYEREFCLRESKAFLDGALASIPTERWLSNPAAIWLAERKLYQLPIAKELGFNVPLTVVTNDEAATRSFANGRQLVAKAVSSGYVDSADGYKAMFTTALSSTDLDDLSGLGISPVIFQERIEKTSDIRVTVIDGEVFGAEIMSQGHPSSVTDWRATDDPELQHRVHELPELEKQRCLTLVKRLGLEFGAIDLALTADGKYTFFEINPNGEWLWLQYQLGFPIAEKIAQWLTR